MKSPFFSLMLLASFSLHAQENQQPILSFPQHGIDDETAYRGYATRFFRDTDGNAIQIYINQPSGRVVHLWADAANESISFTVRRPDGSVAGVAWMSSGAAIDSEEKTRTFQHTLSVSAQAIEIGHFLLCSMRKERDFQYLRKHLEPFSAAPFIDRELTTLIKNLEELPADERKHQLDLLNAGDIQTLRDRLQPTIALARRGARWVASIKQPTFDGRNHLTLELSDDMTHSVARATEQTIIVSALSGRSIQLRVSISSDSPSLTPLNRLEIFNEEFFQYYSTVKAARDSTLSLDSAGITGAKQKKAILRYEWLERNVRGAELLSSQEKLMAGLPNFATYFGRDMMMSALMMEPIWKPAMLEHVIASVLRKLRADGNVSHEEALGAQAIKENIDDYNTLIDNYFGRKGEGETSADSLLGEARGVLQDLQAVRENYRMLDDDFQLSALAARYLARPDVPLDRKRAFLMEREPLRQHATRLALLLRNLRYVTELSRPYVENPDVLNLVGFPKLDKDRWYSGSWRDSNAGYANGRFAMDINAIWVPKALESIRLILEVFRESGLSGLDLLESEPTLRGSVISQYHAEPTSLNAAIQTWRGAVRHFLVDIAVSDARQRVWAKLNWLDKEEKEYWEKQIAHDNTSASGVEFLALSLDENGIPIPVESTDPATWLFLGHFAQTDPQSGETPGTAQKLYKILLTPYPMGLFVDGLGSLAANDVFAPQAVWERFKHDEYHSPRVVWGREVNLILLGLAKQILSATTPEGTLKEPALAPVVQEWRSALERIERATEASSLKHNELWTYRIESGALHPTRYATSSDIQLWNVTDLAVQFMLHRLHYY